MAPEVLGLEVAKEASDVWALGCVLFELCKLKRPFESEFAVG